MSLDQFPDEIVRKVLFSVPPEDILHGVALTNHRLARLSNEGMVWRVHCHHSFKFWHPKHNFKTLLRSPAHQTNWKKLFLLRYTQNRRISELFESMLRTKVSRLRTMDEIAQFEYDAKDFILEQCNADDSLEDGLARRYYARAILDSVHKRIAIEAWATLVTVPDSLNPFGLERGLGAFDMFVLQDQPGDLDDISALLGSITARFISRHPHLDQLTTREKALALNAWIRAENLSGLQNPERDYRNLRNCLIGQALQDENHESIPIISSAIFCCMAERIGLDAKCNGFPSHVHVVVSPPSGRDLDDQPVVNTTDRPEMMYLDPYSGEEEVPASELRAVLARFGWNADNESMLPVPLAAVAARTSANIRQSFAKFAQSRDREDTSEITRLLHGAGIVNIQGAFYASLWATLLLTPANSFEWEEYFGQFLERFARYWPEDVWLVEKYLMPLYDDFVARRGILVRRHDTPVGTPWHTVRETQRMDDLLPIVCLRRSRRSASRGVPFKIGQVFRHRRYGWVGVITGWGDKYNRPFSNEDMLPRTGLGDVGDFGHHDMVLTQQRKKAFFTYIRPTTCEPYVVDEYNVELVHDPEVVYAEPFIYAGKHFKRFDPETCCFISNNREEFPED